MAAKQTIYCDTRQQKGKHEHKMQWWADHSVHTRVKTLKTGDYATDLSNILVDTKRNVAEVAQNINGRQHARFKRECQRAQADGQRLYVLVENTNGYRSITDVCAWENDHCTHCKLRKQHICEPRNPHGKCMKHRTVKPIQGPRLAKAMATMEERYGVRFKFCRPQDAALTICELLGVDYDD